MKQIRFFSIVSVILVLWNSPHVAAQWTQIPELQGRWVTSFLKQGDTLFVGGQRKLLMRSTDGGLTWTSVAGNIAADTILSLGAEGQYIYAGTMQYGVFRSSDIGNTWVSKSAGMKDSRSVMNAFMTLDSTVIAATDYGVYRTKNHGETWDSISYQIGAPRVYGGVLALASDSTSMYATTYYKGVFFCPVNDSVWTSMGLSSRFCFSIATIDTNVFVGTENGVYLYSRSQATWLSRSKGLPLYGEIKPLHAIGNNLFAGSNNGGTFVSTDLGNSWSQTNSGTNFNGAVNAMVSSSTNIVVGTNLGGWRRPLSEIISDVPANSKQLPAMFRLDQNYPNPFNPSTVIEFSIAKLSIAKLQIFDVLGREVAVLVNETMSPGTHKISWDASSFPSGVYFYTLQAGNYKETKKLVLIR